MKYKFYCLKLHGDESRKNDENITKATIRKMSYYVEACKRFRDITLYILCAMILHRKIKCFQFFDLKYGGYKGK